MSISRRRFISMLAGTGAVAAATTLTGCRPVSDPSGQGWLPNIVIRAHSNRLYAVV